MLIVIQHTFYLMLHSCLLFRELTLSVACVCVCVCVCVHECVHVTDHETTKNAQWTDSDTKNNLLLR